jgi:hypothetical protein
MNFIGRRSLPHTNKGIEKQIKGVGPTVFHKKRMANVDTKTLC